MDFLINALSPILDFVNGIAINISEKFAGEDPGAALIMVAFYLIVLILILLLFKGILSVIKDLFRTIFHSSKKKTTRIIPRDTDITNSSKESAKTISADVEDIENKSRTKNSDELSLVQSFVYKKYIDDLSRALEQINKLDNCAVQSQHIPNTISQAPIASEDNTILSKTEKETIKKQVEGKNLSELKDLLKQANKEEVKFDGAAKSLGKDLSNAFEERDKLSEEELTAINQHNDAVDALVALCDEIAKGKSDLLKKHSELSSFITSLEDKKAILLDSIKELEKENSLLPEKNNDFASLCDKELKKFTRLFQQKEDLLTRCEKNYSSLLESRNKIDKDISAIQQKQSKITADKTFNIELISAITAKINELEELEKERSAREEAERLERERQEKLEAERLEKERLAREEAERIERERREKLETERLEKERLAREEAERIAREKEEELKKQELETKDDEELTEIKEQIKRQQQNSYSINYDDLSPEMLERLAIAEQKKRRAKKAAMLNGKSTSDPETIPVEINNPEAKDKDVSSTYDKQIETEAKDTTQNEASSQDEAAPQVNHFAKLKQQWAEDEAHKRQWAEEKARREEEYQRRKKELAEELSGNGFSGKNE